MKKARAPFLLSLLLGVSTLASAQSGDASPAAPAAPVAAAVVAPAETSAAPATAPRRARATAQQPAVPAEVPPADLSTLAPIDSNRKFADDMRRDDRFNAHGTNCSRYPARCP